jgi:hypothetical protein
MKTLWRVAVLALAAVALAGAWRTAKAVAAIARTPRTLEKTWAGTPLRTPLAGVRVRRLGAAPADSLELGSLERAVVFVFDTRCASSNSNMANWMDLVREAPPGAPLYALTYRQNGDAPLLAYWDGMHERVAVLGTDTATLVRRLGIPGTPTTLVVRDGVIRHKWPGPLQPAAKEALLRVLREPARAGRDVIAPPAAPPDAVL